MSNSTYCPSADDQVSLLRKALSAILAPLSPHAAVWFGSHKNQQMPIARLLHRLRFYMQKFIYGGRYLGGESLHGSVAMSTNPDNVHRPKFGSFSGVLKHSTEVNTMSQNNSAQQSEQAPNYDVTFFAVSNKTKIENCTYTDFISPYFETREQVLDFKAQAIAEYPECFIAKHVSEYNSKDDRNRLKLLAKIVKCVSQKVSG